MLVASLGEVVDAVHVAPEHVRREVVAHVQLLVRTRGGDALAGEERRLLGAAVLVRSGLRCPFVRPFVLWGGKPRYVPARAGQQARGACAMAKGERQDHEENEG